MKCDLAGRCRRCIGALIVLIAATGIPCAAAPKPVPADSSASTTNLAQFINAIRGRAKSLENSSGMRLGFRSFTSAYKIAPESISYSDYVVVRLLYEATRDAGFWNLHWTITNMPPNSDKVWSQWRGVEIHHL